MLKRVFACIRRCLLARGHRCMGGSGMSELSCICLDDRRQFSQIVTLSYLSGTPQCFDASGISAFTSTFFLR